MPNQIDVNEIADALNEKMDLDMGNVDVDTAVSIWKYPMPDYSKGTTIASSAAFSYTAPSDGIVIGNLDAGAAANVTVNGSVAVPMGNDSGNEGPWMLQCCKGDIVACTVSCRTVYFIPYKFVTISVT